MSKWILALLTAGALSGCSVLAVADATVTVAAATVSVAATAVKAGATVVGTAVDATAAGVRAVTAKSEPEKKETGQAEVPANPKEPDSAVAYPVAAPAHGLEAVASPVN